MVFGGHETLQDGSALQFLFTSLGRQSVCGLQRTSGFGTGWVGISGATPREAAIGDDIGGRNGIAVVRMTICGSCLIWSLFLMTYRKSKTKSSRIILSAASRRRHIAVIKNRLLPSESLVAKSSVPLLRTTIVVITAMVVGTNIDAIADVTGYSRRFLRTISRRMHTSKLWDNGQANFLHWNDDSRWLFADVLVAYGSMLRSPNKDGKWVYHFSGVVPGVEPDPIRDDNMTAKN